MIHRSRAHRTKNSPQTPQAPWAFGMRALRGDSPSAPFSKRPWCFAAVGTIDLAADPRTSIAAIRRRRRTVGWERSSVPLPRLRSTLDVVKFDVQSFDDSTSRVAPQTSNVQRRTSNFERRKTRPSCLLPNSTFHSPPSTLCSAAISRRLPRVRRDDGTADVGSLPGVRNASDGKAAVATNVGPVKLKEDQLN